MIVVCVNPVVVVVIKDNCFQRVKSTALKKHDENVNEINMKAL